jgi:hypothetical protein
MPPVLLDRKHMYLGRASEVAALLGVDTAALQQGGVTRTVQLEISSAVGQVCLTSELIYCLLDCSPGIFDCGLFA